MFYQNKLKAKKSQEKEFEFDMFAYTQNGEEDETTLKIGQPKKVYNFISSDGTLKSGYGFKEFSSPVSREDIVNESVVTIRGNDIKTIWRMKWYDSQLKENQYYLFYFNSENKICFDNLFRTRYLTLIINTTFTATPYVCNYKQGKDDAILLSGEGSNLMVVTGNGADTSDNAPRIISCCSHYGKLFAITAEEKGTLVYNENLNVLQWETEKTKDLDFGDARGDLNRIMSLDDYIYIFRDFGITKLSEYGKNELFEISHIYQSDSYIYPNTIAESGDKIYFLEGDSIKVFNGSSVKRVDTYCLGLLEGCDNRYAYGECYNGKYYLACRGNFKDNKIVGCEGSESGYKNNLLLVLDTVTEHVDIMRGADINRSLALINPIKSKLVSCFYNDNKGKMGEITSDGKLFGEVLPAYWESGKTDFGFSGKQKRIKYFLIRSESDCVVTFDSEKMSKSFTVKGKNHVQKIRANVIGNQFVVKIENKTSAKSYISNFVLTVSRGE